MSWRGSQGRRRLPPLELVEAPDERQRRPSADDVFAVWAGIALAFGVMLVIAAITVGWVWPA